MRDFCEEPGEHFRQEIELMEKHSNTNMMMDDLLFTDKLSKEPS